MSVLRKYCCDKSEPLEKRLSLAVQRLKSVREKSQVLWENYRKNKSKDNKVAIVSNNAVIQQWERTVNTLTWEITEPEVELEITF